MGTCIRGLLVDKVEKMDQAIAAADALTGTSELKVRCNGVSAMDYEAILSRKLRSLFPEEEQRNEVKAILDTYGVERYEQEPFRVRLAILKLSDSNL